MIGGWPTSFQTWVVDSFVGPMKTLDAVVESIETPPWNKVGPPSQACLARQLVPSMSRW